MKYGLVTKGGIVFGTVKVSKEKIKKGGRAWIAQHYEGTTSINGDFYYLSFAKSKEKKIDYFYNRTNLPTATLDNKGRLAWQVWKNK